MSLTSEQLLFVVEAVSFHGGQLTLVLLDNLFQGAIQVLLLFLQELLLLRER